MNLPPADKAPPSSAAKSTGRVDLPTGTPIPSVSDRQRIQDALDRQAFWTITKAAFGRFARKGGGLLAGSVAFFSLLSVAPVLFIAVSVARLGAREEHARKSLFEELSRWIGPSGADTVAGILARQEFGQSLATRAFHAAVVVYMSTRLFSQMRRSINHLWDIETVSSSTVRETLLHKLRRFVASFLMVTVVEVILLGLVGVKTALAVMSARLAHHIHTPVPFRLIEIVGSLLVVTLIFAAMFRVLPDARIAWRDLFRGALLSACLFSAGATLVSLYLGQKATDDTFGDGGAVVMLLLWVNYSAQIFFFGVAFTAEWARRRGDGIHAVHGARSTAAP